MPPLHPDADPRVPSRGTISSAVRESGLGDWAREQLADRRVRHALFYLLASVLVIAAVAVSKTVLERLLNGGRQGLSLAGAVGVAVVIAVVLRAFQTRIEAALTARFTRTAVVRRQGLVDLAQELGLIADRGALQQHLVEGLDQVLETTGTALFLRGDRESFRRAAAVPGDLPVEVGENDSALVSLRHRQQPVAPDARSALRGAPQLWPLVVRGKLVGFVAGGTRNHAESLDPAEVNAVAALAENVAATLVILDPALLGAPPAASAAPPMVNTALARDNLPRNLPALIGRDRELAQLRALIAANRLVTVTGSGGVGKTRLVAEAGAACLGEFAAGVWLVEFAPLADAALVPSAVTAALAMEIPANRPPTEVLISRLRDQQILLVLDNCEHVVGAVAALVETLLAAAPAVKVLLSSQELIGIQGEQVYRLPSLSVPESDAPTAAEAVGAGAVALFVERARAADPTFVFDDRAAPVVASICRRLDGIPLAREMAAARVPMLGVEALAQRLDERFRVLTGGKRTAMPRQRTLHATLDWSFGLLAERERIVFRRVAIFAGGFSLEAAVAVAADGALDEFEIVDGLASLVAKSLVVADTICGRARYRLLETTRAYALEKLAEANETARIEAAHARQFLDFFTPCFDDWTRLSDADFRARYAPDIDNLRLAVDWAFGAQGDIETGQALLGASRHLWTMLSLANEFSRRVDIAIGMMSAATPPAVELSLWAAEALVHASSRPERSIPAAERVVAMARALGDELTLGAALVGHGGGLALAGSADEADVCIREAQPLVTRSDRPRLEVMLLSNIGLVHAARGQGRDAADRFAAGARLARAGGFDAQAFGALGNLADSLWMQGDLDGALAAARDALAQSTQSAFATRSNVGLALANLHGILVERGDLEEAAAIGPVLMTRVRPVGAAWIVLDHFALRLARSGRLAAAARVTGWNEATVQAKGVRRQLNEQRAHESAMAILRRQLPADELPQLLAEGARMSEEHVCNLAMAP
jgi:predicted ATPase